jgi:hypothetical protein
MQSGMQVIQGLAVLVTGLLADIFPLHLVVGVWSVGGVLLLALASVQWPTTRQIRAAIAAAEAANRLTGPGMIGPGPAGSVPAGPGPVNPATAATSAESWRTRRPTNNHRAGRRSAGDGQAAESGGADGGPSGADTNPAPVS